LWVIVSALGLARLAASMIVGYRIIAQARLIAGGSLDQAAEAAATRLGIRGQPDLRVSPRAACPAAWCWGRRPVIVLPECACCDAPVDWVGVFCHELAHWRRRDHQAGLAAELLTCLLPWNPLAWWAKHRLGDLSELACDDWALSTGLEPTEYAGTLLELVPRRRLVASLAAISRRNGLSGRVAHILEADGTIEPRPGRRWSGLVGLAMAGLIASVALAQSREGSGRTRSGEASTALDPGKRSGVQEPPSDAATHRVVRGTVRDPSGHPIPGAAVFAVGEIEPKPRMVDGRLAYRGPRERVLAEAPTDRGGRFTLDLALDRGILNLNVVVRAAGMGLAARNYSIRADAQGRTPFPLLDEPPVELILSPDLPIEGQLLSPTGVPVAGASVALAAIEAGERARRDGFGLYAPSDDADDPARAPYWPEPAVTDSQGRFRLDGFSAQAQAEITIAHPGYIHEALTVSTKAELTSWHKQWGIKPVTPRFSHVLEPSRPIEGIVTDRDTGQPIAGVDIEMAVSRAPEWRFRFHATTDVQGRYRVIGVAWNHPQHLFANLSPPATSGYLPVQNHREEWPAGVKDLRWDFALKKGRFIRGRVIDADTKQPIAGARVGSTGLTDAQGRFTLSTLPGPCRVFVEGPTPDYQRVTVGRDTTDSFYTYYPHGFARVEVPQQGDMAPLEIGIKKGATIAAQAIDPDGTPLSDVWVSGLSLYASLDRTGQTAGHFSTGLFRMSIFVPGQTYRIFFIQNERALAGFGDLVAGPPAKEPVKVTLRPMAGVKGRLLRPDGSPDRDKGVGVDILMTREPVRLDTTEFLVNDHVLGLGLAGQHAGLHPAKTNDRGEFDLRGLVPGVTNYLTFHVSSDRVEYYPVEPLRPGEVRDLGAIKPIVLTDQNP
jgi:hypothetical protein